MGNENDNKHCTCPIIPRPFAVRPSFGSLYEQHVIPMIMQGYYRLNTTVSSDKYKYVNYMFRPLWPSSGWQILLSTDGASTGVIIFNVSHPRFVS